MSIESEINRINTNVQNTLAAIEEMGGEVPEDGNSDDMAGGVKTIPVGAKIDDTKPSASTTYSSEKIEAELSKQKEANVKQDNRLTALEQAGGIATVEPAQDDVPIVFFGGDLPQTKTDTVMPFKYVSKTKTGGGYVETKAQGNSSLSYPKKNQTVKMYADEALEDSVKVDFKGWGAQKKHVYKANWIDLTHARNIVSAQLWGDIVKSRANYLELPELLRTSPNQGAIDGFPVLVYANGVYQGRYTINIPKDAWMANMDDSLDEHCILYSENYGSGCFRASAGINGTDWSDEIHDTVPDAIKTRWNEVISFVMNSTDEEFKANLSSYFYVDSVIDYLLFGLVSCHLDGFGKNQIYMTYDGQRWIASAYDMDSTWGLYWNGSRFVDSDYARTSYEDYVVGSGNLLYTRLEQNFYEEIQVRWAELKSGALSYSNIMTRFEHFIGIVPPHIIKEDYEATTANGEFGGMPSVTTNNIQQIRSFALARQAWTDEYVAALTPIEQVPCTGITLDQSSLIFTEEGSQTLTAIVTPSNTTDAVVWTTSADAVATVSNGVVTAVGDGDTTITATCGAHSATCAVSVSGISGSGGGSGTIPAEYEAVEYIESDGTQYIDTGVIGGTLSAYEMKFDATSTATTDEGHREYYFSGDGTGSTPWLFEHRNNYKVAMWSGGGAATVNLWDARTDEVHTVLLNEDGAVFVDGNQVTTGVAHNGWGEEPWLICGDAINDTPRNASARVYYVKMWKDGVLVRDYVAAKRKATGVYGLYDLATAAFYESATDAQFTGPA